MNVLVIGNGSAGQRHASIARDLGLTVVTTDPYAEADYENHIDALASSNDFDIVVVASPPDEHLSQVALALDYGAWVLCEKPLCGFGQYEQAETLWKHPNKDKVTVTFNYRWHRTLKNGKFQGSKVAVNWWYLNCHQYRPNLPSWGLLLDHVSHDFDILRWKTGEQLSVDNIRHVSNSEYEAYVILGKVSNHGRFEIDEWVNKVDQDYPRRVVYSCPEGWTYIPADRRMYEDMWSEFLKNVWLGHPTKPSLFDAIQTQYLLEQAYQLLRQKEGV